MIELTDLAIGRWTREDLVDSTSLRAKDVGGLPSLKCSSIFGHGYLSNHREPLGLDVFTLASEVRQQLACLIHRFARSLPSIARMHRLLFTLEQVMLDKGVPDVSNKFTNLGKISVIHRCVLVTDMHS